MHVAEDYSKISSQFNFQFQGFIIGRYWLEVGTLEGEVWKGNISWGSVKAAQHDDFALDPCRPSSKYLERSH